MSFRVFSVILASFLAFSPRAAVAQNDEHGYADIFVGTLRSYAEFRDIALPQVLVDTITTGRMVIRGPVDQRPPLEQRPRLVPLSQMRRCAREYGFRLTGDLRQVRTPGELPAGAGVDPTEPTALIRILNLDLITSDSIQVYTTMDLIFPIERLAASDLMTFTFTRQGGKWELVERKWETGEVVSW